MLAVRAKLVVTSLCLALFTTLLGQAGWKSYTTKDGYLTVKFPSGWIKHDSNPREHAKALSEIKKKNPKLANLLDGTSSPNYALVLYDVNDDPTDGPDNMNAQVIERTGLKEAILDRMQGRSVEQLGLENGGDKLTQIGGRKTLIIWGGRSFTTPSGNHVSILLRQYVYVRDSRMMLLTFSSSPGKMATLTPTFDKIVASAIHRP